MSDLSMPAAAIINATFVGLMTELTAVYYEGFQFLGGSEFRVDHDTLTIFLPPTATALDMARGLLQIDHGKGREDYAERELMARLREAESNVDA